MKKNLFFLLIIGSVLSLISCGKIEKAIQQNVTITPTAVFFDIDPITTQGQTTDIKSFNLNFDLGDEIKKKVSAFGINNLKSIKPKSFTIELSNIDTDNHIGNFETLEVEISATGINPLIAVKVTGNPTTQKNTITIPANGNIELKQLMSGSNIKYTVKGKLHKATTKVLNAKLTAEYELVVGP